MKQLFLSFGLALSLLLVPPAQAAVNLESGNVSNTASGSFNLLLKSFADWRSFQQEQSEKIIALNFEENLSFPSLKEIDRIETELTVLNPKLELLNQQFLSLSDEESKATFLDSIELKQTEVEALLNEKAGYEETYNTRKERQQLNIREFRLELDDLAENIEKQKVILQRQFYQTFGQAALVLGLLILLLFLKALSGRLVLKFSDALNEKRQQVLLRINKIGFNFLILVILFGTVSSQLVSLLPFLALLGTGIAFAVRDALSSFLGWFLIGGENGYRAGQIIKLGEGYGRVHEVTPFLTMIKEIHGDHETGEIISFPNKIIFEQPVSHFSKYGGFVHKDLNFLISEDTNIDIAKSGLRKIITDATDNDKTLTNQDFTKLKKQFNLDNEALDPLVWVENNDHGLALRARFLVKLNQAAFSKATIEEAFIKLVQTSENINFHYTDSGRTQITDKNTSEGDRDSGHFH